MVRRGLMSDSVNKVSHVHFTAQDGHRLFYDYTPVGPSPELDDISILSSDLGLGQCIGIDIRHWY